ncbi:MAG: hypothetical protein QOE40_658, partial [Actinomycetota bacterium]|nr:hypothetical protein [Actinomycetota bacterium]
MSDLLTARELGRPALARQPLLDRQQMSVPDVLEHR